MEILHENTAIVNGLTPAIHVNGNGHQPEPPTTTPAIHTNGACAPPEEHRSPFDRLLAEFNDLDPQNLPGWLIDHAPAIGKLERIQIERFALRAIDRGITQKWLDRSWRPLVNQKVKAEKQESQGTISKAVQTEFKKAGWSFSLNDCTAEIFVNDTPIDDGKAAAIRVYMRDLGYSNQNWYEDYYVAQAYKNAFHPVKDYLESIKWNGQDHILNLSKYVEDDHAPIVYESGAVWRTSRAWLHRWLVGAVAKTYDPKAQNPMLVLAGGQDLGKSTFAQWFGSGLPQMVIEKAINLDDPLMDRYLVGKWIWEVSELGATTKRADREALKAFLTRLEATFKVPYAVHPITRPALASFIGTLNPEHERGFLSDPTGNRRFLTVELNKLDWAYATEIDVNQVWAQAYHLYKTGTPWRLTKEELRQRDAINERHERQDFSEDVFDEYFEFTSNPKEQELPEWRMTSLAIANKLNLHGIKGDEQSLKTRIGTALSKRNIKKLDHLRPRVYAGVRYVDKITKIHP